MSRLSIALLSGFRVMVHGNAVTRFESDKGRALLAYLVVNGERPFKRETLAALFWPESSAKDGRNNLRQSLFLILVFFVAVTKKADNYPSNQF